MQHVGNVAIKPEPHFGHTAYLSNVVFKDSSSKIPLVAAGFDFLVMGESSSLSDGVGVVESFDISAMSLSSPSEADNDCPITAFFPLVLVAKRLSLTGRF